MLLEDLASPQAFQPTTVTIDMIQMMVLPVVSKPHNVVLNKQCATKT